MQAMLFHLTLFNHLFCFIKHSPSQIYPIQLSKTWVLLPISLFLYAFLSLQLVLIWCKALQFYFILKNFAFRNSNLIKWFVLLFDPWDRRICFYLLHILFINAYVWLSDLGMWSRSFVELCFILINIWHIRGRIQGDFPLWDGWFMHNSV